MLGRQRGQMGIGNEVAVYAGQGEEPAKQLGVAICWLRCPRSLTGKPRARLAPCVGDWFGPFEDTRVSH